MNSNLVWYRTELNLERVYLDFWKNQIEIIRQHPKTNVESLLSRLVESKVIQVSEDNKNGLNDKFFKTEMTTINVCPGFGIITAIDSDKCEKMDDENELTTYIANQIRNGLKMANLEADKIIKKQFFLF